MLRRLNHGVIEQLTVLRPRKLMIRSFELIVFPEIAIVPMHGRDLRPET